MPAATADVGTKLNRFFARSAVSKEFLLPLTSTIHMPCHFSRTVLGHRGISDALVTAAYPEPTFAVAISLVFPVTMDLKTHQSAVLLMEVVKELVGESVGACGAGEVMATQRDDLSGRR